MDTFELITKATLPDTLHELLTLAVKDLLKIEKDPNYKVSMHSWHENIGNRCYVCLAGAVMAKTIKLSPTASLKFYGDAGINIGKLSALDDLREGFLSIALDLLDKDMPEGLKGFYVVEDYHTDRTKFLRAMYRMIARLKKHNL